MNIQSLGFPDKTDGVSYLTADECNAIKQRINQLISEHNEDENAGSAPTAALNPTFYQGSAAPAAQLGVVGDSFLNQSNGYFYQKKSTGWFFLLPTRGLSAYEVWLAIGNVGTPTQFLASLKGAPGNHGEDGTDGSRIFDKNYFPSVFNNTNVDGYAPQENDQWFHTKGLTAYDRYAHLSGEWRLVFRKAETPITPVVSAVTVTGFTPSSALVGAGVTLTGSNFTGASLVSLNGTPASFTVVNATTITTSVPAGASSGKWQVSTTSGSGQSAADFTVSAPASNVLPTANAGVDTTLTLPTNQVALMGSGTDADGTVSSYGWVQITGPNNATGFPASSQNVVASNLIAGIYQFRLTVTDDKGGQKVDDVLVTVNAASMPGATYNISNEGDSLSAPLSRNGFANSWPEQLQAAVSSQSQYVGFRNYATAGDSIVNAMRLQAQKDEVLSGKSATATVNFLFLYAGINDLQGGYTGLQVYEFLRDLCLYYVGQGYRVCIGTITSSRIDNAPYDHAEFYSRVLDFNARIRTGWKTECQATVLLDVVTDPAFGGFDAPLNTTFFGDKIHYSLTGRARFANNFAVKALPFLASNIKKVINYDSVSDEAQEQVSFNTPVLLHAFAGANTSSTWVDSGTGGRNATSPVAANRPTLVQNALFGRAAYFFADDGVQRFMDLPPLASQAAPFTVCMTVKSIVADSHQFVFDCERGRIVIFLGGYGQTQENNCIYTALESDTLTALRGVRIDATSDTFLAVAFGPDNVELTVNGAVVGQYAPGTTRLQSAPRIGSTVGLPPQNGDGLFRGYIGAVEVHPGKLSAAQVQGRRQVVTGLSGTAPTTTFADSFERENGAVGNSWENQASATIENGKLKTLVPYGGAALVRPATEAGYNQAATANVVFTGVAGATYGLTVRHNGAATDATGYLAFFAEDSTQFTVSLFAVVNGVVTGLFSIVGNAGGGAGKARTLQLSASGISVTAAVYEGNTQLFTRSETTDHIAAAGRAGIWSGSANVLYDSFEVVTL